MSKSIYFCVTVFLQLFLIQCAAFHIQVCPLDRSSIRDWQALANLRYNEWMKNGENTSSEWAFQRATRELYETERTDATVFLAYLEETGKKVVVGSSEASPHELEGVLRMDDVKILYITDVVTDANFRRRGIAKKLMMAMEDQLDADYFIFHVRPENVTAMDFYRTLGYGPATDELLQLIHVDGLEASSGTEGEQLWSKRLS